MWMQLLTLALASYCLAAPQQQQVDSNDLDQLIGTVFGGGPQPSATTSTPDNKGSGDLNALVNQYLNQQTTQGTFVGSKNKPTPPPDDCECVSYYLCNNGTVIQDGYGLIDIRSGFDKNSPGDQMSGGQCSDYLYVCCKPPDRISPDNKPTPPPVQRMGCGKRHPDGVGFRIIGDSNNETKFGEFPWMVAILRNEIVGKDNQKLNVYQCGGSLIHRQAVLTAAHCVHGKQPSELKVRAGEWDTQTRNEIFQHQDRNVQKVIVHDKYYAGALYNDFAILILTEPVELAENVDLVCLPDVNEVFDRSNCFVTGWGKDKFGKEGHYQVILKKVGLPVVPRDTCQESLRKTRLGKYFNLHETFICAGGVAGQDACKGDGGSPLVCPSKRDPTTYQQAGIVAWGIGCGEDGTPGVYANVATARSWIDEQMAYNNLDNTVNIAMWMQLLTLALAGYCLAAPQQQQVGSNDLDNQLLTVFGDSQSPQPPATTSTTDNKGSGDLNALGTQSLDNQQTTQGTFVGTKNKPTPPPDDCECVSYYLCDNGTATQDVQGLIDIRGGFNKNSSIDQMSAGKCSHYMYVCCKPPDRISPDNKPTPPRLQRIGCGKRHPDGVGFRIIGDYNNETKFGEFPWMMAILRNEIVGKDNQKLNVYQCGGSLIHRQAVLTAAHCVHGKQPSELKVRAGEWDTQTRNEIYPHQDRNVQKVIVHEKYYAGALYYDFAILILTEPVEFSENIDLVCLPDVNDVFDSSSCFVTGWGKHKFGKEGHYQVILKKIGLPVVPRDTCQESLRKTRLGKYFNLHETFICAGGVADQDACKGDGGSPLVCPSKRDPTTYQQAGIVAWGIGCGEDGTPGVYANVATARNWIDEQMANHNLDNTVYDF
nr:uncharacterized protein LOC116433727 [Nomia melanderi]